MNRPFLATRQIGIDMAHRVPNHKSKCRNVHGHRYTIELGVAGGLVDTGSSAGMVEDFGDLKEVMVREIDAPCDHGFCLAFNDPIFINMVRAGNIYVPAANEPLGDVRVTHNELLREHLFNSPYNGLSVRHEFFGKMYIIDGAPTAEHLAQHWYERLRHATRLPLSYVKVWETPNCWAQYPAPEVR